MVTSLMPVSYTRLNSKPVRKTHERPSSLQSHGTQYKVLLEKTVAFVRPPLMLRVSEGEVSGAGRARTENQRDPDVHP